MCIRRLCASGLFFVTISFCSSCSLFCPGLCKAFVKNVVYYQGWKYDEPYVRHDAYCAIMARSLLLVYRTSPAAKSISLFFVFFCKRRNIKMTHTRSTRMEINENKSFWRSSCLFRWNQLHEVNQSTMLLNIYSLFWTRINKFYRERYWIY